MVEITLNINKELFDLLSAQAEKKHLTVEAYVEYAIMNRTEGIYNIDESKLKQYIEDFYLCAELTKNQDELNECCPTEKSKTLLYAEMDKMFEFIRSCYDQYTFFDHSVSLKDFVQYMRHQK